MVLHRLGGKRQNRAFRDKPADSLPFQSAQTPKQAYDGSRLPAETKAPPSGMRRAGLRLLKPISSTKAVYSFSKKWAIFFPPFSV